MKCHLVLLAGFAGFALAVDPSVWPGDCGIIISNRGDFTIKWGILASNLGIYHDEP